jgi:hypothetical protein
MDYENMTVTELQEALRLAEVYRRQVRRLGGAEGAHRKLWARERKARIRAELRQRGVKPVSLGTFEDHRGF